jgi:hypothetical protein
MRINVRAGSTLSAARIGVADPAALDWLGIQLANGGLWRREENGLLAVASRTLAKQWFGDAALAIGKSIEIQGRAFTITGVFVNQLSGFEDVSVWTNQMDDTSSLFNNEFRLTFPALILMPLPEGTTQQAFAHELHALEERLRASDERSYGKLMFESQTLADHLMRETLRVRKRIFAAGALAGLSALISYWLLLAARNLKSSRDNRIRLFLGMDRAALYWEALLEQVILAVLAAGVVLLLQPLAVLRNLSWPWLAAILIVPTLNCLSSVCGVWLTLRTASTAPLRLEPLIACHSAATMALWLVVSMLAFDLLDARAQVKSISPNVHTTLLTMPSNANTHSTRTFARNLTQRLQEQFPSAKVGVSTWLPFLDNSSYDYLRTPGEPPVKEVTDPRAVDFLDCNPGFLNSFSPQVIAGRLPIDQDRNSQWIVLDRRASDAHFATPRQAIGAPVLLLRGEFRVAAVIEPFPFRGNDTHRIPQVFLNMETAAMLFPFLAVTLELPGAPSQAPRILTAAIQSIDHRVATPTVEPLHTAIERSVQPSMWLAQWISAALAGLLLILLLAVSGLTQSVIEHRRTDFGTMLALGAGDWHILRFGFLRLLWFGSLGLALGTWAGLAICAQFADEILVQPKALLLGGLQASSIVLGIGFASVLVPMLKVLRAPIATALRQQSGSYHLPIAR